MGAGPCFCVARDRNKPGTMPPGERLCVRSMAGDVLLSARRSEASSLKVSELRERLASQAAQQERGQIALVISGKVLGEDMTLGSLWPAGRSLDVQLVVQAQEWTPELPVMYPQLTVPSANTRVALPVEDLEAGAFTADITGINGAALLTVVVDARGSIEVKLFGEDAVVARVTPELAVFRQDGSHVGTIAVDDDEYRLEGEGGLKILAMAPEPESAVLIFTSMYGGQLEKCAKVLPPGPDTSPPDHFLVEVMPSVDTVLILACFLARVVHLLNSDDD
uniref:Uncharacterized protein n=1 Tax=Alexandrium monilatum TaxID=311494 RepID=A0A7S4UR68_9DINO|mmetsp:Transcript_71672/g.213928  ORF Transcript_71672/g.213928 Transcript_71672/m.213928 type:complete len:278 (-) Transcript_71672:45-878(-)